MGEVNAQEEGLESILSYCMYCGRHRNDTGFWERVFKFNEPVPQSYETCSEGCQDRFNDEYVSLNDEKRSTSKDKMISKKRDVSKWILVNNKGSLFGDYDREQRL